VNDEERPLRRWDFLHCPAGSEHVFVGAGDGPCAVLMIGSRREDACHYIVNERAAKHDASVSRATDDPAEAYADWRAEGPDVRVPNPFLPPRATR
jgi:hypothetical protein